MMKSTFSRVSAMTGQQRAALTDEFAKASRIASAEPVAVVGIGCRFPGDVTGPDSYWQLLLDGTDAITTVPADRWNADEYYDADPSAPGRITTRFGGFMSDVAGFDADYFGIAPREAAAMDPQQRILLEVAWEALEHAGIAPDSLDGTRTGVMMGVYYNDYQTESSAGPESVNAYTGTGNAHSITVGRISYLLGLRGPSVAVDTACSSSLVAIHLACQSLRMRESDLALAGGVNVILRPETSIAISSWGLLSPDGRCKTFDARADGFVRGEGCGVVVLKRLTDAVRDGDRVLAVVRASAVNQDGRSNGITAPNALAQRDVITDALRSGDITAASVGYVETHGTGTILGDPIEFDALADTYGKGTGACALGAVKTNFGHLEGAAGVAGFIKATLAVQHGLIPQNLHFTQMNPAIDASSSRFFIPTQTEQWPAGDGPRRAGVSSFGLGGTNAHLVVEQGPDDTAAAPAETGPQPAVTTLVVTGKSTERISATAAGLADWMSGPGADVALPAIARTLHHHRSRQPKFATVCARDHAGAVAGLQSLAEDHPAAGVTGPHDGACRPGTVFVYSGQGSQWAGMGRRLLADEPVFAAAVADLDPTFTAEVGFSLQRLLADGESVTGDARVQPAVMGLQLALTELWRHYGVTPDAVIGHSMGEVTAAVVAGALTAAEGLRLISIRSKLMSRLAGQGAVALLELDPDATEALIGGHPDVTLTVYSSPRQSVIAGPPEQVDELIAAVQRQDRLARRVNMEVASHHPTMDPLLPELRAALADLRPAPPRIPIIPTALDPASHPAPVFDADYWVANLRNPVRFSQAVAAAGASHGMFVEVSPHPVLTQAVSDTLADIHHHSIGTLRRDGDDTLAFHTNLNATHTSTPPVSPRTDGPLASLPATPWKHSHHWVDKPAAPRADGAHPLLGAGVTDPGTGTRIWENTLSPDLLWLQDHRINDEVVLPGAAYAEMALAAAADAFGDADVTAWTVRDLTLERLMHVADGTVVVTTLRGDESSARIEIGTRGGATGWTTHATATVERAGAVGRPWPPAAGTAPGGELDPAELYRRLRSAGQQHGPAFQGITAVTVTDGGVARAAVALPAPAKLGGRSLMMHPVMVDIALQTLAATTMATGLAAQSDDAADDQTSVLPVRLSGVQVFGDITAGTTAHATLKPADSPDRFVGQVQLTGADGTVLLAVDEIEMVVLHTAAGPDDLVSRMFVLDWQPESLPEPRGSVANVLLIADPESGDALPAAIASALAERDGTATTVSAADPAQWRAALTRTWDAVAVVLPPRAADEQLSGDAQLHLAQDRTLLIANVVSTLSRAGSRNSPRLWILTRGAQQVESGEPVTLAQSPLRGIARVLTFEHPELRATILDIDADGTASDAAAAAEVLADADHDEVALRAGERLVHRLVRIPTTVTHQLETETRTTTVDVESDTGVRLEIDTAGRLDGVGVHAVKRAPLAAGEVEVRVTLAGLNFSDVLKAMGVYPGLDGRAPVLGAECVGVVGAVGTGVTSVRVGQRVAAFGAGTFASRVVTTEALVAPIPDGLSDADAATFGLAYVTAWYSLREIGRLAPGERVLIHSATGGVGLAAVAIAKLLGARVYTTAGTPAKRQLLATMDVDYVGDSRGTAFADEILAVTDGEGVDVVLNSLPGEAIRRGVQILAPGGRFIELGKKDVHADAHLGLAALAKSASFAVVDLDLNLRRQPALYGRLLAELLSHAERGDLPALPVTEFAYADALDGFRLMASGNHIGKILIALPATGTIPALAAGPAQPLVRPDGGYIVTGGLGGVGFVTARWLAAQGAGLIVLNGRSGPGAETSAAIAELTASGTRVEVVTGDLADAGTAARLVAAVEDAGFPLCGVLHSATVIDDQIVLNVSDATAARVFRPKVTGGWRLHEATADRDLDWWVAFSSAASLLGSPGQGAYAAANSWVDGLVAHRRSLGLPAVGINWGPWAEVGRAQSFANLGFSMITPDRGMAAMELLLTADRSCTGVFGLDARQWFQSFPSAAQSSLFSELAESATTERRGGRIRTELEAMPNAERPARLASVIADEIRAVLRSKDAIDHDEAMASLGLDSLMALELRNRLESSLDITLPAALVWAYPTISDLAQALCERLGFEAPPQTASDDPDDGDDLADEEMRLLSDLVLATEAQVDADVATGASDS
ncbi:MAG: type I polyketide synthase [Actinobacteria bacterium]|nr:type I polyketide synthase [Actinomycetota bacterium]